MTDVPLCAARLSAALDAAQPALLALSDIDSAKRPGPQRWSPREIIGHLIDSASNNHQRFVRAAWTDDLVCAGYEQEEWVELQRYQETEWPELIAFWASFNRQIARVMTAVPEPARMRVRPRNNLAETAMNAPSTPDEATLNYFMLDYVDHLEHHLRQVLGAGWRA